MDKCHVVIWRQEKTGKARVFDLVWLDFSESCGYMQYLLENGVLYKSRMSGTLTFD